MEEKKVHPHRTGNPLPGTNYRLGSLVATFAVEIHSISYVYIRTR